LSFAEQARAVQVALPITRAGSLRWLLVGAICALPVLLYVPFYLEPFMRDEGFYASTAQLIVNGDGIPYRDAFDNKPPLIFGWFSLSFLVFGETVWAPKLLASICLSITTLLIYFQGRMLFSHRGGLIAALAFALSIGIADFQTNANTEYFLLLPMTAALVSFTLGRRTGRLHWLLLSGVLSGVAVMTKQVAAFNFLALIGVVLIAAASDGGWRAMASRKVASEAGAMTLGLLIAIAAVSAPFVLTGAAGEYFEGAVVYAFGYSNSAPLETKVLRLLWACMYLTLMAAPWLILAAIGVAHFVRKGGGEARRILLLWLIGSTAGIAATGRFYEHYFVQGLPAVALLAPAAIDFFKDRWSSNWARTTAMVLLPVSAFLPLSIALSIYVQPDAEARHEMKFASGQGAIENTSPELAGYVKSLTQEGDYIYNLGFQSELYFYADRRSPTRFLFDHAFAVDRKYEEEALNDLKARPPVIVIDSAIREREPKETVNYYPVLVKEWIDENYEYLGRLYYADLYRLKGAGE
jgi:4-amino-4-deoxy-L-arabinose transferase-like glycosyltransferase